MFALWLDPWPGEDSKIPPKRGGFLDKYPSWHAALRDRLAWYKIITRVLDSWDSRFDPPQGKDGGN